MMRTEPFKPQFQAWPTSVWPDRASARFGAARFRPVADQLDVRFGLRPPDGSPSIPSSLIRQMEEAANTLYGDRQGPEVARQILRTVTAICNARPPELVREDLERPADWYKQETVYMFYPERFGVKPDGSPNTFWDLIPQLDYLKELGVTTLYVLPFLDSPMIDAGFDVRNYKKVREDLGGNEAFEAFLTAAREKGFKVKADMILNHVSDQHPWFQQALQGDAEKLNYFVTADRRPRYRVRQTKRKGYVAYYREADGACGKPVTTPRRLIFPDISRTHWRGAYVNGTLKHFYHTFYPHQIDLNWNNPKVMLEMVSTLGYWANQGIDIFRFDAIPFLVKEPGSSGENLPKTHAAIRLLSSALQAMAPRSVIQAEACQWPRDIRPYYGQEKNHGPLSPMSPGDFKRTDEVQIAYHFPLMPAIWASMIDERPDAFWKAFKNTPPIPESAAWAMFLRVHDELTLEMVDPKTRQRLYDKLAKKGEPFREGLGVSGRLADFLDNDPRRIGLIYSILFSMPGIPIIYYGDEIGARNSHTFMRQAAEARRQAASYSQGAKVKSFTDTRDLGRAPIAAEQLQYAATHPDTPEGRIFQTVKGLIALRKKTDVLTLGDMKPVRTSHPNLLSLVREKDGRRVLVVHNLSGQATMGSLQLDRPVEKSDGGPGLLDLRTEQRVPVLMDAKKRQLTVSLQPYQSLWLELPA